MNCRDVIWILDNQKGELAPAQRREAEAHVTGCADCASAWNLQAGLADLPYMALPPGFSNQSRLLVASTPASLLRQPAFRRNMLVGTLTALAAAAVLLQFVPRQSAVTPPVASSPPVASADVPPVIPEAASASPPVELSQPATVEASTTPHFLVRVRRPSSDADSGDSTDDLPEDFVEKMRVFRNEPSRKQAVDSFRDALIRELQRIPGLILVESDLSKLEPASSRKYQLRIGAEVMVRPDGQILPGLDHLVAVRLTAEQIQSNGKSVIRLLDVVTIELLAPCTGAAQGGDTTCPDPRGTAAVMARNLREQVFPPEPSAIRALQARLRDSSLSMAQRSKSLFDLLKFQQTSDDMSLLRDPGVVRGVIDLAAAAGPALRARIWRAMRGTGNKDLIPPLMNSLVSDPVEVRLAALETLADFRNDARVRSTLESIALGDSRPLVRAVAERGLSGEAPWRQYVVASLKDSSRSASERTDALMYYLYPPGAEEHAPSHPDYWQLMQELLDDGAVTALAQTLADAGSLRGSSNNFLGNFAPRYPKNPAVTDMLLTIVENDKRPNMRSVAGEVLARMHAGEPRVRTVLDKVIQNDPDASVRDYIRERMPPAGGGVLPF